jgi:Phasin protein
MATDKKGPRAKKLGAKKSEVKKPSAKRTAATAAHATARKTAMAKAPASVPQTAPVPVNAFKPEEKAVETALVERTFDTFESLKAAVPAAVAVNHKLVDIAQTNMKAGMALARDLASAKSPLEMMQLGMTSWQAHLGVLEAQARELRMLSAELMTTANEPIRARLLRG